MSNIVHYSKRGGAPITDVPLDELDLCRTVLAMTRSAILIADTRTPDVPLVWVSDQFEQITGYAANEAVGKNCRYLQGADRLQPEIAAMRSAIEAGQSVAVTLRNYRKDGTAFWNQLSIAPLPTELGRPTHFVGLMRDVTAAIENIQNLKLASRTDLSSGALNRHGFLEDLDFITKGSTSQILVVKIDLADIHTINSSYGYEAGDFIIRRTVERLGQLDGFAVGRIGNNEFAIAFQVASGEDVARHLKALIKIMEPPFIVGDSYLHIAYALGYDVGQGGWTNAEKLTQNAGYALHESKADPLRRPHRFDTTSMRDSQIKRKLTNEMSDAAKNGDFVFHYQPKVDLETGLIYGAEALMRWRHPLFGLQDPSFFMQAAEDSGLIIEIEKKSLEDIFQFACSINADNLGRPIQISMNASPRSICHECFVDHLVHCLNTSGLSPSLITLEITESLLLDKSEDMRALFNRIRAAGVGLAIDDFGIGYSSLASVTSFPITEIKIDKAFTQKINKSGTMRVVVEMVLALGAELQVDVVAEGLETEAHRKLILDMGCRKGQGFLFGRPMEAQQFAALLSDQY